MKTISLSCAGGIAGAIAVNALAPTLFPEKAVYDLNQSFWADALPQPNRPLAENLDVDVVIIGGGFTGLSTAYYLAQALRSSRICLLEAVTCGNGASGRNGAMILNLKNDSVQPAIAKRLYDLTYDNISRIAVLAASGVDCDLERHGALTVMSNEIQTQDALNSLKTLQMAGLPLEYWDRDKTSNVIGTRAYAGAIFDSGAGQVHPGKLVAMWKHVAQGAGVRIYEHSPVVSIRDGSVHELTLADGHTVRAPILVLATNAYSSKLGFFRNAVAPITNCVGITEPLDVARLGSLGWTRRIPFNDSRREVFYGGLTNDRRIHFGGGPVDYAFNDDLRSPSLGVARYTDLRREFIRIFPSLVDVSFERTWSGFVDVSRDQEPAVGQMGKFSNIFYGIGYSGEGINLSSVFGRIIADLVAGQRSQWEWFPYLNRRLPYIPNEPFRWLGIHADLAYSRLTGS